MATVESLSLDARDRLEALIGTSKALLVALALHRVGRRFSARGEFVSHS